MLEEVKSRLRITWDDEDDLLEGIIEQGEYYLDDLTGVELDYEKNGQARSLLFEYCRYAYNNALEYFEENFSSEILRLQLQVGVDELVVTLDEINIESVELEPDFSSAIKEYEGETTAETSNIEAVPRRPEADITITVDSETIENDTAATWDPGENTVEITVENNDNSRIYTVVVTYEN